MSKLIIRTHIKSNRLADGGKIYPKLRTIYRYKMTMCNYVHFICELLYYLEYRKLYIKNAHFYTITKEQEIFIIWQMNI